jgi:hypothetical protein
MVYRIPDTEARPTAGALVSLEKLAEAVRRSASRPRQRSERRHGRAAIDNHLSPLRSQGDRNNADRCMLVLLYLPGLHHEAAAERGRMLRLLLIRHRAMPVGSGGAERARQRGPSRSAPEVSNEPTDEIRAIYDWAAARSGVRICPFTLAMNGPTDKLPPDPPNVRSDTP